jgi:hypothetical protein
VRNLITVAVIAVCLTGCNRGVQSKDAVRSAVIDYLKARQFNTASMDVNVSSVNFEGKRATAAVTFAPKGASAAQGMSMQYQLEQQDNKWVVVGRKDSGGHGGGMAAPPPSSESAAPANPHGGMMPAPESLPPAGKK